MEKIKLNADISQVNTRNKILRIMKLTVVFSYLIVFQICAGVTYSQNMKTVSLFLNDVTVEEAINRIEKEMSYSFLFTDETVDVGRKVNISVNNGDITDVLSQLLRSTDIGYQMIDRQIILAKNKTLVFQQEGKKTVTGTVVDTNNEPVIGANIKEKDATNGIVTDVDGKFSLNVTDNAVLQVSYIGYVTQEISTLPENGKSLLITLQEDMQALEEVVVVGYGTVSRKNLTTAISKVTPDKIVKAASSNMSQLLLGQAAGLQATVASAQPGGNVNISIRGAGTPVYVVDGIVVPGGSLEPGTSTIYTPNSVNRAGLAGLNPQDIESVEILKDASASIYGIGAANGVILITTKKGKEGALKINYDGSVSTVRNYDMPASLDAQQYMNYVNIFNREQYLYNNRLAPYGDMPYTSGWSPIFSDADIANAQTTPWRDYVLRNGSISNHTLTISGGAKSINYYISGNYFNQKGQMLNSGMERYSLKSNIGLQVAPFIKLTASINVYYNSYLNSAVGENGGGQGNAISGSLRAALEMPPHLPVRDEAGTYTRWGATAPNPVALLEINDQTTANGSFLNFAADVDIVKNLLSARLAYGNNLEQSGRSIYIPSYVFFYQKFSSRGNLLEDRRMNQTMEATVMFNKRFFDAVNLDAVVGVGRYRNHTNGMKEAYDGQQYDAIGNDNIAAASGTFYPSSYRSDDEKRSQFVRAGLDILDRYVVSGTLRRDGTDKFFPGKKYALFPSVSLAWKLSNESFLRDVEWLNLLKLRASYGTTGSDNLGTTLYGTYGPATGNFIRFNNASTQYMPIRLNGLDYPDISWQKTAMKNAGVDFYLFRDRLSGSFDVFQNDITDLLGSDVTAGLSMFGSMPINGGHTRRQGWDASVNSRNIIGKDFSWSTLLTLTKYKYLWMERFPNYDYRSYEIKPPVTGNAWYMYETAGIVNADKSNMPASQPAGAQWPGYPIITDQNGDGEITADDIVMVDTTPDLYWGLGNTFTYGNFDLNIFLYSMLGVRKSNPVFYYVSPSSMASLLAMNGNSYVDRMWNSQTNPDGTRPGIAASLSPVTLPEGVGTDIDVQDASFVRVRNITLGYTVNGRQLGAVGKAVSSLRLYVDVQNPFTFTRFEGLDPEVTIGRGSLPQARTWSLGINLSFY
jgi:TonB-linked SusC/RagA family outer membrane protein